MPQFVILRHEMPPDATGKSHWDLMLEEGETLRSWVMGVLPQDGQSNKALQTADHRLHYLEYEGPISENRGDVKRYDRGEYVAVACDADRWIVRLAGEHIRGELTLQRSSDDVQRWDVGFSAESEATRGTAEG